jgi:hypothetical protein
LNERCNVCTAIGKVEYICLLAAFFPLQPLVAPINTFVSVVRHPSSVISYPLSLLPFFSSIILDMKLAQNRYLDYMRRPSMKVGWI